MDWDKVAGSAIGAGLGFMSAREQRSADRSNARQSMNFQAEQAVLNRNFSAKQAQLNRDFQRDMSNTAVQRRTADMRAAGINPLLSVSSGMAGSSPQGSVASGSAPSGGAMPASTSYIQSIASGLQLSRMFQEVENVKADTRLKNTQAGKEISSRAHLDQQVVNLMTMNEYLQNQNLHERYKINLTLANKILVESNVELNDVRVKHYTAMIAKMPSEIQSLLASADSSSQSARQKEYISEKLKPFSLVIREISQLLEIPIRGIYNLFGVDYYNHHDGRNYQYGRGN